MGLYQVKISTLCLFVRLNCKYPCKTKHSLTMFSEEIGMRTVRFTEHQIIAMLKSGMQENYRQTGGTSPIS
ncbi:hypothetical protein D3C79_836930 [compost metagenome]